MLWFPWNLFCDSNRFYLGQLSEMSENYCLEVNEAWLLRYQIFVLVLVSEVTFNYLCMTAGHWSQPYIQLLLPVRDHCVPVRMLYPQFGMHSMHASCPPPAPAYRTIRINFELLAVISVALTPACIYSFINIPYRERGERTTCLLPWLISELGSSSCVQQRYLLQASLAFSSMLKSL
jgi:hypothetical protein